MMSVPQARRMALAASASALIGLGVLTACGTKEKPAETPAPSSPSATAPVTPSEKAVPGALTPGVEHGGSFRPSVTARPAPTALP